MKLKGSIIMSRPSYSDGRKCVAIACEDRSSGIRFLDIEIPYDEFVLALTSSCGEMEYELRGWMHVGKKRELKTEMVWVPKHKDKEHEAVARKAVEAVEADGWRGRISDALNVHRTLEYADGGRWQQVIFHRYVEPPHD